LQDSNESVLLDNFKYNDQRQLDQNRRVFARESPCADGSADSILSILSAAAETAARSLGRSRSFAGQIERMTPELAQYLVLAKLNWSKG
jgi:hypothetical protein